MRSCTALSLVILGIVATLIANIKATGITYGNREKGDRVLNTLTVQRKMDKKGYVDIVSTGPASRITQVGIWDKNYNDQSTPVVFSGGPGAKMASIRIKAVPGTDINYAIRFVGFP